MFININKGINRVALNTAAIQALYIIPEDNIYKVYALMEDTASIKIQEFNNLKAAEEFMEDITSKIETPF